MRDETAENELVEEVKKQWVAKQSIPQIEKNHPVLIGDTSIADQIMRGGLIPGDGIISISRADQRIKLIAAA